MKQDTYLSSVFTVQAIKSLLSETTQKYDVHLNCQKNFFPALARPFTTKQRPSNELVSVSAALTQIQDIFQTNRVFNFG